MTLRGALAAAVTPLRDGAFDAAAVGPYVDFLAGHGLDGILVLGTTGEGVLFSPDERRAVAAAFLAAAHDRLQVAVHCGAQTTRDTAELAAHAAAAGADAVAVIGPPYFPLDPEELLAHFEAAAAACAPLPFYLYEFQARSGYAIPLPVIERLRERVPNLAGMKVSDSPWERLEPYLGAGLDVFVGAEALLARALPAGAAGAVSGLAASFPDAVVPLVREPTAEAGERATSLRASLQQLPFHAAAKAALALRGVPLGPEVRAPLRGPDRGGARGGRADRRGVAPMSALRSLILAAADSKRLQRLVQRYGFRLGAARFVAGETLDAAVPVLRRLNDSGLLTNTTLLGEGVPDEAETREVVEAYAAPRPHRHRGAEHERCAEAHAARPRDRRGARVRERRRARRAAPPSAATSSASTWRSPRTSTRRCASTAGSARRATTNVGTVLQAYLYRTRTTSSPCSTSPEPSPRQGCVPRAA